MANSNSCSISCSLFGRNKISSLMGDVAKGIKVLKNMSDNPESPDDNSEDKDNSNKA